MRLLFLSDKPSSKRYIIQNPEKEGKDFKDANITVVGCSQWMAELAKKSSFFKNTRSLSLLFPTQSIRIFSNLPINRFTEKYSVFLKIKLLILLAQQIFLKQEKAFGYHLLWKF